MSFYHRLRRQFFSRIQLARLFTGLIFVILLTLFVIFLLPPFIKLLNNARHHIFYSLPQNSNQTSLVLWIDSTPSTIFLVTVNHDVSTITLSRLSSLATVPSLKQPLASTYSQGEARLPGSGGRTLVKSSIAELTGKPVHFIIFTTPSQLETLTSQFSYTPKSTRPLLSRWILFSPARLRQLYSSLYHNFSTDLPPESFLRLLTLAFRTSSTSVIVSLN